MWKLTLGVAAIVWAISCPIRWLIIDAPHIDQHEVNAEILINTQNRSKVNHCRCS